MKTEGTVAEGTEAQSGTGTEVAEVAEVASATGGLPPADKANTDSEALSLSRVSLDELKDLKGDVLRALCKAEGLPVKGKVAELIKRLRSKKLGGDKQVVHGNTLCKHCHAPAHVIGSKVVGTLDNGQRMVRYRLKCNGQRPHRFTVKQKVGVATK